LRHAKGSKVFKRVTVNIKVKKVKGVKRVKWEMLAIKLLQITLLVAPLLGWNYRPVFPILF